MIGLSLCPTTAAYTVHMARCPVRQFSWTSGAAGKSQVPSAETGRFGSNADTIRNPNMTVPVIAHQEQLTIGYLSRLLRLPSLAPDIIAAVINSMHPPQLSAK